MYGAKIESSGVCVGGEGRSVVSKCRAQEEQPSDSFVGIDEEKQQELEIQLLFPRQETQLLFPAHCIRGVAAGS